MICKNIGSNNEAYVAKTSWLIPDVITTFFSNMSIQKRIDMAVSNYMLPEGDNKFAIREAAKKDIFEIKSEHNLTNVELLTMIRKTITGSYRVPRNYDIDDEQAIAEFASILLRD